MATKAEVWRRIGTATRVLNSELKKEIIHKKAVKTGRMRNVSKIVKLKWNETTDDFSMNISTTQYYKFVDKGTRYITPREITRDFMKRPKVIDQLEKVAAAHFEYLIDQQFR